jgi:methionine-rich copper-binding protein CopC
VLSRRQLAVSRLALACLVVGALVLWAPAVLGHSTLETADPAADSTITESPTLITANFTERIDPGRSSMELRGPDGTVIAKGGVAPGDPEAVQMVITPAAPLAIGTYEVRWTTVTPDDNGIERGTYTITIVAVATAPATPIAASASAEPEESESASASAEVSEVAGSPETSAAESVAASEAASEMASASGSGGSTGGTGGGGPDLVVVGGVAVVLLVVVIGAGMLVARSRRD